MNFMLLAPLCLLFGVESVKSGKNACELLLKCRAEEAKLKQDCLDIIAKPRTRKPVCWDETQTLRKKVLENAEKLDKKFDKCLEDSSTVQEVMRSDRVSDCNQYVVARANKHYSSTQERDKRETTTTNDKEWYDFRRKAYQFGHKVKTCQSLADCCPKFKTCQLQHLNDTLQNQEADFKLGYHQQLHTCLAGTHGKDLDIEEWHVIESIDNIIL